MDVTPLHWSTMCICYKGSIHLDDCRTADHPLCSMVLMLKPNVGLTVLMSSPLIRFTMVVLPALSSPLQASKARILIRRGKPCEGTAACCSQTNEIDGKLQNRHGVMYGGLTP